MSKRAFKIAKSAVSLFDHITKKVHLKKVGGVYKGLCPFHKEKTPSFTYYHSDESEKQSFYCFGCGKGGTIIDFVVHEYEEEGITAYEALDKLKEEYDIEFDNDEAALEYIKNQIETTKKFSGKVLNLSEINLTVSAICRNHLKFVKEFYPQSLDLEQEEIEKYFITADKVLTEESATNASHLVKSTERMIQSRRGALINAK